MKTNTSILSFALFATLLFGCNKENDTPGITYQLRTSSASASLRTSSASASTIGGTMAGSVQWTSGYASITEIEFEAEKQNLEVEYKSEVRTKIDLFSPLSTLGIIEVPPGVYEEIEFEVEIQQNGTESAFELNGNFTNGGGTVTPIVFKVNTPLEIEAEHSNITITDGASLTALTTLDLSMLTAGVTETMFNNATRTGGKIEISSTSNPAIYAIMFENLKNISGVEVDD